MGFIKFNGITVYEGEFADFKIHDNWCDSMATYYPYVSILYVVGHDEVHSKVIPVIGFSDPSQRKYFEVLADNNQANDLARIIKARKDKEEAETIRMHKLVRVVRGRKVPIGTEGEVFWMGNSGYGMSVGIRLIDGKKVFTSMKNVETVQLDRIFETEVLGLKK